MVMTILVVGLVLGGTFALMALGLTIRYGAASSANLALGQLVIGGSFLTYLAITATRMTPSAAFSLMVPLGYAACYLIYPLLIGPLTKRSDVPIRLEADAILVSVGLMFALQSIYTIGVAGNEGSGVLIAISGIECRACPVAGVILVLLLGGALCITIGKRHRGMTMRTVVRGCMRPISRTGKRWQARTTFAIGGGLAVVGGIVWSLYPPFTPMNGTLLAMKVLVVLLMGCMGDLACAIAAGLILALVETGVSAAFDPGLTLTTTCANFLLVLLWRPVGLPS
ncbi:branched-chain amino acid ABC transporter permease [Rhizobium sp. BK602]|uniref:branched-chain amino acid ABC transporter permease n=1 Tax=Rhizobium sp. BK602 TaxID=2586986 RepID=UPI001829375C|nr:branched-chain amino acid ABC transporter permease [Rhizobium sp. BK602]MBB3612651.1 branched-chain amino acid transport system permease protein [Rhizobium sp. BK602]